MYRRILVPIDLAADEGLLEDVLRLQQEWRAIAQRARGCGEIRRAGETVEHRIEIMQRMADLIEREVLGLA